MGEELLDVYDLKGTFLVIESREKFYKEIREEFKKTGSITRQIKTIRMLLVTSQGRVYIQKRSRKKSENPGLYDKTVGGHVKAGHTRFLTAIQECHEELGIPAVVLSQEEFDQAISSVDLGVIAILREVDHINQFISLRKLVEGGVMSQPFITTFYVGYYDGPIHFKDGEATGIEVFDIKDLLLEIKERPELFTEDLKFMLKRYEKYLKPIGNEMRPVKGY